MSGLSEAQHPNVVQVKSEVQVALGKRKAEPVSDEDEDTDDDQCMEVEVDIAKAPTTPHETRDDEDDDCVFAGRSGCVALADVR